MKIIHGTTEITNKQRISRDAWMEIAGPYRIPYILLIIAPDPIISVQM